MTKDKERAYEMWANLTLPIAVVLSGAVGWFTGQYVSGGGSPAAYVFMATFAVAVGVASAIVRAGLRDKAQTIRFARQYEEMVRRQKDTTGTRSRNH